MIHKPMANPLFILKVTVLFKFQLTNHICLLCIWWLLFKFQLYYAFGGYYSNFNYTMHLAASDTIPISTTSIPK